MLAAGSVNPMADFLVGKMLVMTHENNLCILVVQLRNAVFDAAGQLLLRGGRGGCELLIADVSDQLLGRAVQPPRSGTRLLPIHAAFRRQAMAAVGIDDPIAGDMPEPQMERHRRITQIVLQPAIGFYQDILHHVADVDPLLDPLVKPHLHQPANGGPVAIHQAVDRLCVAALDILEQLLGLVGFGPNARHRFNRQVYHC